MFIWLFRAYPVNISFFVVNIMSKKTKIINESGDRKYFTIIPNYILNHSTLWDREVYIQMKRITGEDGTCWTSQKTLAKQCGISINRLKKSIQYLLEHKWIEFVGTKPTASSGGTQETKEYKVIDLWEKNIDYYKDKGVSQKDTPTTKGVSRDEQRGITSEAKGVSPSDDKEEPLINKNPIKKIAKNTFLRGEQWNELIDLFGNVNPLYREFYKNKTERNALDLITKEMGFDKTKSIIEFLPKSNTIKFVPKITKPTELKRDLAKLLAWASEKKQNKKGKLISFKK